MMFAPAQIGEIKIKSYEEAETEWEISYWSKALDRIFKFTRLKSPVFTFSNASWYFQLEYGENDDMMAILNFSLKCKNDCSSAVQLTYGLKKQDGNVEERGNVIWKENNAVKYFLANIGSEFATSDVLTIKCTLKWEIPQPTGTDQSKFKKLIKLRTLSSNFRSLFANKENCDKTLLVQEKKHKAHGAVLVARSSVFAAMLKHDTLEKQTGVITIPDCDSDTFHQFLEFLYCGKLDEMSFCSAIRLYETSEKYDVQELKTFCMDYLVKNVTAENFRQVVILADKYGDARLFATVQDLFNKNLIKILDTSDWECLLKHNYGLAKELLKGMATKFNELDFAVKNTKTKELRTLSSNFRSLFANKENCDKTLLVQEKEHKAHGAVLVARSSVFAAMLKHDTLEKQTGVITIPDCDSDTFHQFLEFLYCGKLDEMSFCSAIRLYETSEKYDVQELKTFCMDYLVKSVTAENFRQVVILADKYGDARLFATVQDLFNKNLIKILDTSDWECLLKHNYGLAKELLKGMATKFNELDFAVKNTKTKGNFKRSIFCNENFTNVT